jgi:predicted hydrolase (HD superfamily)
MIYIPFSKEVILYIKDEKMISLDFSNVDYIINNYEKENSFLNLDLIDALIGTEIQLKSIMAHDDIVQALDMEKIIKSLKEKEIFKNCKEKKITNQEDLKKDFEKLFSDNKINLIKTNDSNLFNLIYYSIN